MQLKGKLEHVTKEQRSGEKWVTFGVEHIPPEVYTLQDKDLLIEVKPWKDKRSLDANAYYWALIEKIAATIGLAKPVLHNKMLRRYGVLKQVDGENEMVLVPDTDAAENEILNASGYHYRPTSLNKIREDGKSFRAYLVLKGSHEYNTAEMAALIDGVISEAKDLGIETIPDEEFERMMDQYEKHHAGR